MDSRATSSSRRAVAVLIARSCFASGLAPYFPLISADSRFISASSSSPAPSGSRNWANVADVTRGGASSAATPFGRPPLGRGPAALDRVLGGRRNLAHRLAEADRLEHRELPGPHCPLLDRAL